MKYYLSIDNGRAKLEDKSDRYTIIDLSNFLGVKTDSIESITGFTSKFKNGQDLYIFLIENGLLSPNIKFKPFTICYKYKGVWNHRAKKYSNQSGILFEEEAFLLSPSEFVMELNSLLLNKKELFNYQDLKVEEKGKLGILDLVARQVTANPKYQYCYAQSEGYLILNYLNSIKQYGYIDNKYIHGAISDMICRVAYKGDQSKINMSLYYELVMLYVNAKRDLIDKINQLENIKIDENTGEIIEKASSQKKLEKTSDYEQLSFFD